MRPERAQAAVVDSVGDRFVFTNFFSDDDLPLGVDLGRLMCMTGSQRHGRASDRVVCPGVRGSRRRSWLLHLASKRLKRRRKRANVLAVVACVARISCPLDGCRVSSACARISPRKLRDFWASIGARFGLSCLGSRYQRGRDGFYIRLGARDLEAIAPRRNVNARISSSFRNVRYADRLCTFQTSKVARRAAELVG